MILRFVITVAVWSLMVVQLQVYQNTAQEQDDSSNDNWHQFDETRIAGQVRILVSQDYAGHAEALGVTPHQMQKLESIVQAWNLAEKELMESDKARHTKIAILKYQDELEAAKELEKQVRQGQSDLRKQFLKQCCDDVLLPFQIRRLVQMAKQRQIIEKADGSDEFALLVAIIDDVGLTPSEKRKALALIDEVRSDYLEEVQKLREKTEKTVLECLPKEHREEFVQQFGEFYDYPGELEAARKKRQQELEKEKAEPK